MLPEREPHEQDGMPALLSPGIRDQDDGFHSKNNAEDGYDLTKTARKVVAAVSDP